VPTIGFIGAGHIGGKLAEAAVNLLEDVTVIVPDWEEAIGNDTAIGDLGRLTLRNVRTGGSDASRWGDLSAPTGTTPSPSTWRAPSTR
jgi:hypothetical protein